MITVHVISHASHDVYADTAAIAQPTRGTHL